MKKQILSLALIGTMLTSTTLTAGAVMDPNLPKASEDIAVITTLPSIMPESITINGEIVDLAKLPEIAYTSDDGDLMVPLRALAEKLGYEVNWNEKDRSIELINGPQYTLVSIGKDSYFFAKMAGRPLGEAPTILENTTYVPVAFFQDILKTDVKVMADAIHITTPDYQQKSFSFTFDKGLEGFVVNFADLPVDADRDSLYELHSGHATIPVKDTDKKGIYITGHNRSDDLFMYFTKELGAKDGLKPNTRYEVDLSFKLATNSPAAMMGIGGAPGESVFVKAGVTGKEPLPVIDKSNYYRLNVDKGNQANGGKDLKVLGNITKTDGSDDKSFQFKDFKTTCTVVTDDQGRAFIIIGTDSGYEGKTELYYTDIMAEFREL